jgi:hypothetical protein
VVTEEAVLGLEDLLAPAPGTQRPLLTLLLHYPLQLEHNFAFPRNNFDATTVVYSGNLRLIFTFFMVTVF